MSAYIHPFETRNGIGVEFVILRRIGKTLVMVEKVITFQYLTIPLHTNYNVSTISDSIRVGRSGGG